MRPMASQRLWMMRSAALRYINADDNIIALRHSGTGKTHAAGFASRGRRARRRISSAEESECSVVDMVMTNYFPSPSLES